MAVDPNPYTRLVFKPAAKSVNTGYNPLPLRVLIRVYGDPRQATPKYPLTDDGPVTSTKLKAKLVERNVGPFKVYGHEAALESLATIFAEIKREHPDLYPLIGTAGMLNCRVVRGTDPAGKKWSNHAFGFAIDITIAKSLDRRGDNKIQAGLLLIYSVFKRHGWYWGVEFPVEDGMHFEPSAQLITKWEKEGKL